jgi:competence protein ComEC
MKFLTKFIITCLVLLIFSITYRVVQSPTDKNSVDLYFFDVDQGDAALIQKDHYQILIDGGPDDKVLSEIGSAMPLGDKLIEKIILTHPHADHITGLNQVLARYEVGEIVSTAVLSSSNQYLEFLSKIKDLDKTITIPGIGQEDKVFDNGVIEYFWPGDNFLQKESDNLNNSSLVFRFCYFEKCTLFMGDLEIDGQAEMFSANESRLNDFKSNTIKVSHHGSKNGGNSLLYEIVAPQKAIISAGRDNQYGHPSAETLELLKSLNIEILRTDKDKTINIRL